MGKIIAGSMLNISEEEGEKRAGLESNTIEFSVDIGCNLFITVSRDKVIVYHQLHLSLSSLLIFMNIYSTSPSNPFLFHSLLSSVCNYVIV